MIIRENYTEAHIMQLKGNTRRDQGLIERTLFAFGLLEALAKVGMEFTFKGGTSLMLLLSRPLRLSTDIDIVVRPGTDIDEYISKASKIFPFKSGGEQDRKKQGAIEKRHFKFVYDSPVRNGDSLYILLDVLFEENHYEKIVEREIANDLLLTEGENLKVRIPSIDCILGDKLTAFAPHTIGIPIGGKKNMEVMKQFYDVSTLIDEFTDFDCIRKTYYSVSKTEIGYRGLDIKPEDALMDTIKSAICICSRGKFQEDEFPHYVKASRDVSQHIYEQGFSMERAVRMAPKIIYMAACIMTDKPFVRIEDPEPYRKKQLSWPDMVLLKGMRRVDPLAYGYLIEADRLLSEYSENLFYSETNTARLEESEQQYQEGNVVMKTIEELDSMEKE